MDREALPKAPKQARLAKVLDRYRFLFTLKGSGKVRLTLIDH